MKELKKLLSQILILTACIATTTPLFAGHGTLSSIERDGWINLSVNQLVTEGVLEAPSKPVKDLTNLEVAQLTSKAGEVLMAQADLTLPPTLDMPLPEPSLPSPGLPSANSTLPGLTPAATGNMSQLIQEFREELSGMGTDVAKLEDRIYALEHRNESLAELQKRYLKRTGAEGSGYSRGYINDFRGFGANPAYGPMVYNAMIFMDMRLKSIPVPFILFETDFRFWRTIGYYYAEPHNITNKIDLRWMSLTSFNEIATVTGGDFFKHYTPLTLWNSEVPVFTFIEPASYYRTRKDVEELAMMNRGPDWYLRGFQISSKVAWPESDFLSYLKFHTMVGPLKQATQFRFGDYFAGSQVSTSFLNDNLEFMGTGLYIWDDTATASGPYNPNFPLTFARKYHIGSLSARVKVPFADDVNVTGSTEYAATRFEDDLNNPLRVFEDWAVLGTGSLNISGFHLTGKYLNNGPYFYSPGAQTNRFTPGNGSNGYLTTNNLGEDEFLIGYLNRYGLQGANRPSFAPFDRMVENMLPYGDATPNRLGVIGGISVDIGKKGWLKPQASWVLPLGSLQMHEIQANYVLNGPGDGAVDVDSTTNTGNARTFGGWEAAVSADLAKAFDLANKTYHVAFDYKNQTTDLGTGAAPFAVNTLIGAVDFTVPISGFDSVVLSAAFEQATAAGNEYVLTGVGNPGTIANYPFYLDSSTLGQYVYTPLNITRTSWAFGFKYPLSQTIAFRADYFINQYLWSDLPNYERRDQIWRFTYEASF